jgi:DNA gyrase/topoisomerase IV subunit A
MIEENTAVEEELTAKEFQTLLFMTSEPTCYTEKTVSLVKRLHKARLLHTSNKWVVKMTDEDVRTAVVFIEGYCLNRPTDRARLHMRLCRTSERFRAEFEAFAKGGEQV